MKDKIFKIYDKMTKNITRWREYLSEFERANYTKLKDLQLKRLEELKQFPEHKGAYTQYNISSWDIFNEIPFKTKEYLRNFKPKLKGNETTHFSSGSTGEPLKTYGPEYLQSIKPAVFERAWKSVGWNGKDKILRLTAGIPQWGVFDWLRNVKPMNYRTIGPKHYNWIIKNKPFLIHGGSGAIREITTGIIKLGKEDVLKDITLYLMSEDTRKHTKYLKKYYKAVYSGYGLAELCTVASQCKYGNYHVNMETCIVEIIKGEIVVTDLFNNITPIIRYRTKDYGKLRKSDCKCGRKHDILYDIVGRGIDYYDGVKTKKPIGWWILSPISNNYGFIIKQWKVKVDLKKNKFILYVVWNEKNIPKGKNHIIIGNKGKPASKEEMDKFKKELDKMNSGAQIITDRKIEITSIPDIKTMSWYNDWIKKESGLDLVIRTQKSMTNKKRMKLLEIVGG